MTLRLFKKVKFITPILFLFFSYLSSAEESFISLFERNLTPSGYYSKTVDIQDTVKIFRDNDNEDFYRYTIFKDFVNTKNNIYANVNIKSITLNNSPVRFKLKKFSDSESILVIGEKGKYFSTGDNVFRINYTLDYSHYEDVGVIRKFTNKFIQEEGSLPVRKVVLKVNAPPMSKIERFDYKNTIDGKAANNYVVEGSLDSVKMQSSSDISNKESMRLNAVISKVVTTYWGQDISTLFPTLPIDNDYYRICFSLLAIVLLSKFVLMLLEALMQSTRAREYVVAMRTFVTDIVSIFGFNDSSDKQYRYKYK